MTTFFSAQDYLDYLTLSATWFAKAGVEVWAYCLMPNHVHLIAVPQDEQSLRRGIGEAHRRFSLQINAREGWRGHLWQERFHSFPMDEHHLLAAARYIEQNPVRAGLAETPWQYRWSSARAHLEATDDALVKVRPLLELAPDWREFITHQPSNNDMENIRKHMMTGHPWGAPAFIERLENIAGRPLMPLKRGRKRKDQN